MDENSGQDPEQQRAGSGNRWEPVDPEAEPYGSRYADPYADPYASGEPTGPAPWRPVETAAAAPPSRPTWQTRARAVVAGGAVAALLVGGLGGFAVGRATAGDDGGPLDQQGVPTGFDRNGDGGLHDDHGGQVPGIPGQDDGQQQDDGTNGSDT